MRQRLDLLYQLGAAGCIVWASSGDKLADGQQPVFDRNSGAGKTLLDFAATHR